MECLNCKAKLYDGSKFCVECGAPIGHACPSCGLGNPPNAKFCANCGTKLIGVLTALGEASASLALASLASSAERRHLTVMFCDLVGSTALSTQLDPEDLGRVIADFRAACTDAVAPFGGSVAQYMGDGALVYFGYPEAYEDAPTRAILAGLGSGRGGGRPKTFISRLPTASRRHRHRNGGRPRIDRRRRVS